MGLPEEYKWLGNEPGPVMLKNAIELLNTQEKLGSENNPVILGWAKEVGDDVSNVYKSDEIPWCGLFMAVIAKRSSKQVVKDPLWALNWGVFGKLSEIPMLGDVIVFTRETSDGKKAGHVALYVGEDATCYHVIGGNQLDSVCITRIKKSRLYVARRPNYNIQPKNVRVIKLKDNGKVSYNEQ